MPTKNKKKDPSASRPVSDKAYIQSGNARKLSIHQCLVSKDWREAGLAQVIVSRRHVTGNITGGFYLVDLLCTGVKDSFFFFNQSPDMLTELQKDFEVEQGVVMETCDYVLAHNIIYSALDFAGSYGIEPMQDFATTKMILETDDDDRIELMDIECGKDGKPFLMANPSDPRRSYYLRQLQQFAGEGGYEFFRDAEDFENDAEEDEDDEDDFFRSEPETWDKEDWEDFILEGAGQHLEPDEEIMVYIYQKAVHIPEAAIRQLDTVELMTRLTRGITYEPIVDRTYGYDPEENKETEEMHLILFREKPEARKLRSLIPRILDGMQRWPNNPIFHNYLYNAYILLKDKSKAEDVLLGITERFPDYLFGKIAYAQKLLQDDKADKMPALFGGHFDLSSLYPERNSFHVSEFNTFTAILCFYYLQIGDDLMAGIYGTLLKQWAVDPIPDFTTDVLNLLDLKLEMKVLRKLAEASKDAVKREELIALLMS